MNTTTIFKGVIGTIGVGGMIVGGYYGSESLFPSKTTSQKTKDSIRSLISKSGRTVLDNKSNNDLWEIKLSTYELFFKSPKKVTLETEDENGLKKWCENATKKITDEDDSDYSIVQQLCTRPTNKETLQKRLRTLADDQDWERKAEEYRAEGTTNIISEIKNRNEATAKQIKDWCEKTLNEEILEKVADTYNLTLRWCTKEGK